MKINESELYRKAGEVTLSLLQGISGITVERVELPEESHSTHPDIMIDISSRWFSKRLILTIKARGEPRLARDAVTHLLRFRQQYENLYGIFLAPYISPRAADICQAENVGTIDLSGNCRLSFDGIFIEREGRPNKFAEKRDLRTLYSPRATRVLRALLSKHGKSWKVVELAETAEVSLGLVSNVKKLMNDREWLEHGKNGFSLSRPTDLLKEWSKNYAFRRNESRDYYSLKSPAELEPALAKFCEGHGILYALTSFSAAVRLAPAVRYQRAFAYVDSPLEDIAPALGLKVVSSGPNVTLLRPYDKGVFFAGKEVDGIRIVCPIQAYLDLVTFKGRGEEAAEALLKELIEPQW